MLVLVPVFLSNLNTVSREWDVCDPAGIFGQECISFSAAVANNPRLDGFSHPSKRSEVWALGASRIGSPESLRENPLRSWLLVSGSWQPSWHFQARRHINLLCHHLFCVSRCPLLLGTHSTVSCPPPLAIQPGCPWTPHPPASLTKYWHSIAMPSFFCLVWFLVVVASLFLASMYSLHGLRSSRDISVREYNMR